MQGPRTAAHSLLDTREIDSTLAGFELYVRRFAGRHKADRQRPVT